MTNDTTSHPALARLQKDLIHAVAGLRCIRDIIIHTEGAMATPEHALILLEGVLDGLEGYADGEKLAIQ